VPRYLSGPWFDLVRGVVGDAAVQPDLVVTHHADGDGRAPPTSHTQSFAGGRLCGWAPGAAAGACLTLRRPVDLDRDDLLARANPGAVATGTVVALGRRRDRPTDVWGVRPRLERCPVGVPPDLRIAVGVEVPDSPFGPLVAALRVEGPEVSVTGDLGPRPDVTIGAHYGEVSRWLHETDSLLGHLMRPDRVIAGDIFRISALEGIVSAPAPADTTAWEQELHRALHAYADARNADDFRTAMDLIDELTD
jgi:hypothetical protein